MTWEVHADRARSRFPFVYRSTDEASLVESLAAVVLQHPAPFTTPTVRRSAKKTTRTLLRGKPKAKPSQEMRKGAARKDAKRTAERKAAKAGKHKRRPTRWREASKAPAGNASVAAMAIATPASQSRRARRNAKGGGAARAGGTVGAAISGAVASDALDDSGGKGGGQGGGKAVGGSGFAAPAVNPMADAIGARL